MNGSRRMVSQDRKNSRKIEFFGRIFLGHQGPKHRWISLTPALGCPAQKLCARCLSLLFLAGIVRSKCSLFRKYWILSFFLVPIFFEDPLLQSNAMMISFFGRLSLPKLRPRIAAFLRRWDSPRQSNNDKSCSLGACVPASCVLSTLSGAQPDSQTRSSHIRASLGPLGKTECALICRVGMVLSFVAWFYTHSRADVVDCFCSAKSSCRQCWAQYQESDQPHLSLNFVEVRLSGLRQPFMGSCLSLQNNVTLVKRSEFCAHPESWPVPRVQGQGLCNVQRKGNSRAAKLLLVSTSAFQAV